MNGKRDSLARRLSQIRKIQNNKKNETPADRTSDQKSEIHTENEKLLPGSGWRRLDSMVWERHLDYPPLLPEVFEHSFLLPEGTVTKQLCFYDLETTGLSGGTGNTAFLIGLGRQDEKSFKVIQLFLADYPGETVMLNRYAQLVGTEDAQVSFNGRSFDFHVLKTRFLLNRLTPITPVQIDLLHPSRRLWGKLLPDVTLKTLEQEVLGIYREDDLPGSEAPGAWFDWLKGDPSLIEAVMQHNADDIVSLGRLLGRLEDWGAVRPDILSLSAGYTPPGRAASAWGMARQWSYRDQELRSLWLQTGWQAGDRSCGHELAIIYKRSNRWEDAKMIWFDLIQNAKDINASVELAKYFEHREKSPRRALDVLGNPDDFNLTERQRRDLEYRLNRLRRKLE